MILNDNLFKILYTSASSFKHVPMILFIVLQVLGEEGTILNIKHAARRIAEVKFRRITVKAMVMNVLTKV